MANYRFKPKGEGKKGIDIVKGVFTFHPWALLICFLIAFVMWIYAVNYNKSTDGQGSQPPETEEVACAYGDMMGEEGYLSLPTAFCDNGKL